MIKLIKSLIQEKKEHVRISCLEFIDECIKETCKRDSRFLWHEYYHAIQLFTSCVWSISFLNFRD
jgi:hypothetical protein